MPLPTFFQDPAVVTARNAEYTGTPCSDTAGDGTTANPYLGCNRAGSNAPGVGIATGVANVQSSWTIPDQNGVARNPQDGQTIGGLAFVDRSSVSWPSSGGTSGAGDVPINTVDGADVNDTCVLTDLAVGWVDTAVV